MEKILYEKRKTFITLFLNYEKFLIKKAYEYCNDWDDAKDIVQDLFTRLWDNNKFLSIDNKTIGSYLITCVRNECATRHIKLKTINKYKEYRLNVVYDDDLNSDVEVKYKKNKEDLIYEIKNSILKMKAEGSRNNLKAIFIDGKNYKQLSNETGKPVQILRNSVQRGMQILRKQFKVKNGSSN